MLSRSILALILLLGGLVSCQHSPAPQASGARVLFNPALRERVANEKLLQSARSITLYPFERAGRPQGISSPELEDLSRELARVLDVETEYQVLNVTAEKEFREALAQVDQQAVPLRSRAQSLGKKVKSDLVMFGLFHKLVEREGSGLGANQLAQVSYSVWLVDVASGETVWEATFEERDQPLSENLFRLGTFAKAKGQYRTSREIVRKGYVELSQALEALRTQALEPRRTGAADKG